MAKNLTCSVVVLMRGLRNSVETQNATRSSCISRTMYTCMHKIITTGKSKTSWTLC